MNRGLRLYSHVVQSFAIAVLTAALAQAQQSSSGGPVPPGSKPAGIADAWNSLLQGAIPQSAPDPTLTGPQNPVIRGAADDFQNHFYFDTRTEYIRQNSYFTGNPTVTNVINAPFTGVFNPAGIPFSDAFQPSSNELYSFMDFGTTGWISDRVNTHFSLRYRQDLTHVDTGSQGQDILNTFGANRRFEMLSANVEILGKPTDGWFANSSITLGRQYVYGAELADIDGAAYTMNRKNYSVTLYGGRRFSYYSDPDQRAVGGANFVYRFSPDDVLQYEALFYIRGTHVLSYRRRINSKLLAEGSYKMIGSFPIDFKAHAIWTPSGKGMVRVSFAEKLTNKDYIYDYTINARDLDPNNPLLRLYLGPESPFSQVVIEARRTFNSRFRLGGQFWGRRLVHSQDAGPFDTSFKDYHVDAQVLPTHHIETFFDFHQRDSDRLASFNPNDFFDITQAGETRIQDFSVEVGRNFGSEGRFRVKAGGFYRRMNFQDRFFVLQHLHDRGLLANLTYRVDDRTRLFLNWDLDTDFFVFAPSLKDTQIFRIGVQWRY